MRGRGGLLVLLGVLLIPSAPALPKDPPPGKGKLAELEARVNAAIDRGVAWLLSIQKEDGAFPGELERMAKDLPLPPDLAAGAKARDEYERWGRSALALYTLRACGVPRASPGIVKGFAWLREEYLRRRDAKPAEQGGMARRLDTYGISIALLALDAQRRAPENAPPPDQKPGRRRSPGAPGPVRPAPAPESDRAWMAELAAWLVGAQARSGGFGYHTAQAPYEDVQPPAPVYEDHSNTQYALLGLKSARCNGIRIDGSVWLRALRHLMESQEGDGPAVARDAAEAPRRRGGDRVSTVRDRARGWGYRDGNPATGSMTTGGVSSLAICRSELPGVDGYDVDLDARSEQSMFDGIAWLGVHFTLKENPGPANAPMGREMWQYYYLYGLERAGILAGVETMGGHGWYPEGAQYLVDAQGREGAWAGEIPDLPGHGPPRGPDAPPGPGRRPPPGVPPVDPGSLISTPRGTLLDTCFALLFLKRATRSSVASAFIDEDLDLSGAEDMKDKEFGDLFAAVFRRYAAADARARAERAKDFVRMGTRAVPLLLMRLDDADAAVRGAAIDALLRTTGMTRGYDAGAPVEARTSAIRAWEDWWAAKGATLVADPEAGKYRET